MGLLDELKQQAEAAQRDAELTLAQLHANCTAIDGALRAVFKTFYELNEQLKLIPLESPHVWRFWGVGEWQGLRKERSAVDMRLKKTEGREFADSVDLVIRWLAPSPLTASYGSQGETSYMKDKLWALGLQFDERIQKNEEGRFVRASLLIEPQLLTRLHFEALPQKGLIRLIVRNLDRLQEDVIELAPADCTPELGEELLKAALGKPNTAGQLLGRGN
ncbi:hypothetical protein [Chitinilyticum aquatile]|uniref:hypothetical protein n=1 Tax=Chitinilyticum aquatile TaxID=362520 RepID=UPI0003F531D0|nr:hypothetical protein [Chitinilyticum aquatile]